MILLTTCIPQINFSNTQASPMQIDSNVNDLTMNPSDRTQIKLAVQSIKNDGSREVSIKELSVTEYETMTTRINKIVSSQTEYETLFDQVLQILQEYDLVDPKITVYDLLNRNMSTEYNFKVWNLSQNEPAFVAMYSPVVIAGMGFGGAIGDTIGLASGNVYCGGGIGLGGIVCLDFWTRTIHTQTTFTFPLVVYIISGFTGIMLFPVHFDKLYASGLPLSIYSNFIAVGLAGWTVSFFFPMLYH